MCSSCAASGRKTESAKRKLPVRGDLHGSFSFGGGMTLAPLPREGGGAQGSMVSSTETGEFWGCFGGKGDTSSGASRHLPLKGKALLVCSHYDILPQPPKLFIIHSSLFICFCPCRRAWRRGGGIPPRWKSGRRGRCRSAPRRRWGRRSARPAR